MTSKDKVEIKTKYGSFFMYRGVEYAVADRNIDLRIYKQKLTDRSKEYTSIGILRRSRILYRTPSIPDIQTMNNVNIVNIDSEMLQDSEVLDIIVNGVEHKIPTALLKMNSGVYELDDILAIKYTNEAERHYHSILNHYEYTIQLLSDDKALNYSTFRPNIAAILEDDCFIDDPNLSSNSFYFSGHGWLSEHSEEEHYTNDYIDLNICKIKMKDLTDRVYISEHSSAGRCKVTLYDYLLGLRLKDGFCIEIGNPFDSCFQGAVVFCKEDETLNPESTIYIGLNVWVKQKDYLNTYADLCTYIVKKYKDEDNTK